MTGAALPEAIAAQLRPDPAGASQTVLRIVFTGANATAPVISRLSRSLDIDVTVLAGQVDAIAGKPFGNLIVAIPAKPGVAEAVIGLASAHGLQAEVLGHVA